MGDKRNYAALDWVIDEIGETLNDARQSLEAYVEDTKDTARIRFCLTHIHQVHGSLQMVEFHGASLFADEMESLAEAIMHGEVVNEKEAQEALMRSLLQLPLYLDQVKTLQDDHPGAILPLLNDLRAVRKQSYLSETNLFTPDLSCLSKPLGQRHSILSEGPKLKQVFKKLREMYQYAAASVLRGIKVEENLEYIEKVVTRLEGVVRATPCHPLWHVSVALVEALIRDDVEMSIAVRGLLRQLAQEIKILEDNCPESLEYPVKEPLLRNLLYYVARAENSGGRWVAQVKERYKLEAALLMGGKASSNMGKGMISPPEPEAIRAVVVALQEELNTVKHLLDSALSDIGNTAHIEEMLPIVKRIADTLAVMGIGDMRKEVVAQYEVLKRVVEDGDFTSEQLVDMAGGLAKIENRLVAVSKGAGKSADLGKVDEREQEILSATSTVIDECRQGFDSVKDAIVDYMSSRWNPEHLLEAVEVLHKIHGGLELIELPRSSFIVKVCGQYIKKELVHNETIPGENLKALAESIASVDYYLERYAEGHSEDLEMYLDLAEEGLKVLGFSDLESSASSSDVGTGLAEPETNLDDEIVVEEPISENEIPAETSFVDLSAEDSLAVYAQEDDQENDEPVLKHQEEITPQESLEVLEEEMIDAEVSDVDAVDAVEESDIDDEIIEIFVEEAGEVQETLAEYVPMLATNLSDQEALSTVRRAFHTLKGSGRMVEAMEVGEIAWAVENMLNRIMDGTVSAQNIHLTLIERVLVLVPAMVEAFKTKTANPDPASYNKCIEWANLLAEDKVPADFDEQAGADGSASEEIDEDQELREIFASEARTHLEVVDEFVSEMESAAPIYGLPTEGLQRALHTLKGSAHMADITPIALMITPLENFVKELRGFQVKIDDDILQLIKDAGAYTREGLSCIEQRQSVIIIKQEQFIARVHELNEKHVVPLVHAKEHGQEDSNANPQMLNKFMAEGMKVLMDADLIIDGWASADDSAAECFATDAPSFVSELTTLEESSKLANLPSMASLSAQLASAYKALLEQGKHANEAQCEPLKQAHFALIDMMDQMAAGQNLMDPPEGLSEALQSIAYDDIPEVEEVAGLPVMEAPDTESLVHDNEEVSALEDVEQAETEFFDSREQIEVVPQTDLEPEEPLEFESDYQNNFEPEPEPEPELQAEPEQSEPKAEPKQSAEPSPSLDNVIDSLAEIEGDDFDPDILDIFLEEASELVEELDETVHAWESDWDKSDAMEIMTRALHTFKGGARLCNLKALGELTHEYESFLLGGNTPQNTADFFPTLQKFQDLVINSVKLIKDNFDGTSAPNVPSEVEMPVTSNTVNEGQAKPEPNEDFHQVHQEPSVDVVQEPSQGKPNEEDDTLLAALESARTTDSQVIAPRKEVAPSVSEDGSFIKARKPPQKSEAPAKRQPQDMIKVSSELLEELVNLAGETSISRGRMEQQVSDINLAVEDIDGTLKRLNEQLRRLDMETEAQVLFKQEQMAEYSDFDALEMDRYSQLQQLTRSLMESSSDLMDLKLTLIDRIKGAETLLLQQSRTNLALQEGLMRSRMVPFSRLVPRLRRIVRQVASELGKNVSFDLDNVEGEMDRSVLERMIAPLEHMLRNAVDHGIETPQTRKATGKPEEGRILLSLAREGGDILIRLADDGQGVNLDRVRQKALDRGMIKEGDDLSDQATMQFILEAGFSTAESVTQISGRGVGMDVVAGEIKQLGGSIVIDSKVGVGTQFTVRLPFTVSVNRALMVQLGEDTLAIPLNTIEGIVRVSPFELEHYYGNPDARFEYAGEQYRVRYLGSVLNRKLKPRFEGQVLPLPVILVRSAQHTMAFQVDALQGSREIVVKSLGSQFASVHALSGATVTGDGSVVVILDPHAIVRREVLGGDELFTMEKHEQQAAQRAKLIMVVDDSVTVRKVTTRFLERQGYDVITAKDGIDALQKLEINLPDLMLLDIEMPRMDGFEVAKNMRSTKRCKDIPIVMITSRTGDKHRQHALSIGVNEYVGKPFQEDALIRIMNTLLGQDQESESA